MVPLHDPLERWNSTAPSPMALPASFQDPSQATLYKAPVTYHDLLVLSKPVLPRKLLHITKFGCLHMVQPRWSLLDHSFCVLTLGEGDASQKISPQ